MIAVFAIVPTLVWLCVGLFIPGLTAGEYLFGAFVIGNGFALTAAFIRAAHG